ncbi:MAG TPA: adenylosuccinate lyase [Candidatus Woesebacteria bacterium]|nr:adenylosuccinate lyase [Candidatus Woesebacteria bacterium]
MLTDDALAISPIDGRYRKKTSSLRTHFSEAALISSRIKIEVLYLKALSASKIIRSLSKKELLILTQFMEFDEQAVSRVKEIEKTTHHDVKAVEYYLAQQFASNSLKDLIPFIHFAITSEDINNLAYRSMLATSLSTEIFPSARKILEELVVLINQYAALPILARTHGQAAIPTTFGKEFAVFAERILLILEELQNFRFHGKFNGAVGGYQAMQFTYPEIDWPKFSKKFVNSFGFDFVEVSTQICPADDLIKLFTIFYRLNGILLDLDQDIWRYISDGWLVQKGKENFVGSSTMPQKINPIEFENSEGNLIMANALFEGMMRKLPISRLQRDLSESTVLRNIGSVFAYCLLAYSSLTAALSKLDIDKKAINKSLFANYNILAEAWQSLARKKGEQKAYEKVAKLSKNRIINKKDWQILTKDMDAQLKNLSPTNYLGLSVQLSYNTVTKVKKFLKQNPNYQVTKKVD